MIRLPAVPLFYRLPEVAKLTGLPRVTLGRMCHTRQLPHCRRSATDDSKRPTIFVPREAVQQLLSDMDRDCQQSVLPAPEQSRVRPITSSKRGRRSA